jgi:hypothetical protein
MKSVKTQPQVTVTLMMQKYIVIWEYIDSPYASFGVHGFILCLVIEGLTLLKKYRGHLKIRRNSTNAGSLISRLRS